MHDVSVRGGQLRVGRRQGDGPAITLGEHGARVVLGAVAVLLADEEDD